MYLSNKHGEGVDIGSYNPEAAREVDVEQVHLHLHLHLHLRLHPRLHPRLHLHLHSRLHLHPALW